MTVVCEILRLSGHYGVSSEVELKGTDRNWGDDVNIFERVGPLENDCNVIRIVKTNHIPSIDLYTRLVVYVDDLNVLYVCRCDSQRCDMSTRKRLSGRDITKAYEKLFSTVHVCAHSTFHGSRLQYGMRESHVRGQVRLRVVIVCVVRNRADRYEDVEKACRDVFHVRDDTKVGARYLETTFVGEFVRLGDALIGSRVGVRPRKFHLLCPRTCYKDRVQKCEPILLVVVSVHASRHGDLTRPHSSHVDGVQKCKSVHAIEISVELGRAAAVPCSGNAHGVRIGRRTIHPRIIVVINRGLSLRSQGKYGVACVV